MNENCKGESKISAKSFHRSCLPTFSINALNVHNNNNANILPNPHKSEISSLQHSLSIMPPYRYANSESSSSTASFSLLPLSRRRWFQRQTCLFCIIAAFMFGLILGVFVPLLDLRNVFSNFSRTTKAIQLTINSHTPTNHNSSSLIDLNWLAQSDDNAQRIRINHSTIVTTGDIKEVTQSPFAVAFIRERQVKIDAKEILSDSMRTQGGGKHSSYDMYKSINKRAYHMKRNTAEPHINAAERSASKVLDIDESEIQMTHSGPKLTENMLQRPKVHSTEPISAPMANIINSNIYWGELVERALPQGFSAQDTRDWNAYVASKTIVQRLEQGCGRMQNRLIIFNDGTRACARYRQNTDQIQGELFSFYLGRLLNITNLAPSAIVTVNVESEKWSNVLQDITQAQWKQQRPVVLTRWLPNLEPAGIPQPFQPLDRHLNKYDVWNITTSLTASNEAVAPPLGYSKDDLKMLPITSMTPNSLALERLVELAQWSDLIIFDYLIANLDRVVNNLYNYQWNADIMAAPAHNLARQSNSQLLIFLDNESGLLHGYRLLKKYEAYHGLLLNNLCVFREPTIRALRQLRESGAGHKLREIFEQTTSNEVRDVLPTLPDKSIKILIDRIDRVLGQVDNCKQLMNVR